MTEKALASLQVQFVAPLVVDHRRSPPPFLSHFRQQHIISGVNRATRRCHRPLQAALGKQRDADVWRAPHFTSEAVDIPPFGGREEQLCRRKHSEPSRGRSNDCLNICQSSSNELKPDGTSLPPLVCLPHHLQLQLLCYIPANFSPACKMQLYFQHC